MTPRFFIFKVKIFVTGLADIIGGGCNVEYEDCVKFVEVEAGTGRQVYRGEDGRYYLREVSRREPFAKWYICGKRRVFEDGSEPRANLIFECGGQKEKVRYDDWNGVAAYSDTFNQNFHKEM